MDSQELAELARCCFPFCLFVYELSVRYFAATDVKREDGNHEARGVQKLAPRFPVTKPQNAAFYDSGLQWAR